MKPPHPFLHTPQPHRLEPCHQKNHHRRQQHNHLKRQHYRQGRTFLELVSFSRPPAPSWYLFSLLPSSHSVLPFSLPRLARPPCTLCL